MGGRFGGTRAHLEDGDLDGDDGARLVLGPGVVLLAEHHDVHAVLTEGRAHGRRRVGFTGLKGQLDYSYDFLGHRLEGLDNYGSPGPRAGCGGMENHPKGRPPQGDGRQHVSSAC